jgi:hypothetical protein
VREEGGEEEGGTRKSIHGQGVDRLDWLLGFLFVPLE